MTTITYLKKLVKSRLKAAKKDGAKEAANHFNKWLSYWGNACTDIGARKVINNNYSKFIDLLPGKSHKAYNKWMEEAKQLNLI